MKKIILICLMLLGIFNFSQTQKTKFTANKKLSFVTYTMKHPMHNWNGTSKEVTSVIIADKDKTAINKMAVSIKISTFDSQNANRDSHMIEAAEAIKYPNVTFYSTSLKTEDEKVTISGKLNFHGVEKPIVFVGTQKLTKNNLEIAGSFVVKITDFKIKRPSIMGMETDDEIKIYLKLVY